MKDMKTILEFVEARDPFGEDYSLRSIVTGVITDKRVNVGKAKEVGQYTSKTMTNKKHRRIPFLRKTNKP